MPRNSCVFFESEKISYINAQFQSHSQEVALEKIVLELASSRFRTFAALQRRFRNQNLWAQIYVHNTL